MEQWCWSGEYWLGPHEPSEAERAELNRLMKDRLHQMMGDTAPPSLKGFVVETEGLGCRDEPAA